MADEYKEENIKQDMLKSNTVLYVKARNCIKKCCLEINPDSI